MVSPPAPGASLHEEGLEEGSGDDGGGAGGAGGAGGGGGGASLQLQLQTVVRVRNPRLDAMLAEKKAKAARKLAAIAAKAGVFTLENGTKRHRGRIPGWILRKDAPELLSDAEFNALTIKELHLLWSDYYYSEVYEGIDAKSCNRPYLRRKLVKGGGDESSTMTSSVSGGSCRHPRPSRSRRAAAGMGSRWLAGQEK